MQSSLYVCDWVDRSKAKLRAREALRHHATTTFVVNETRELKEISYSKQGDPALNTEEARFEPQRAAPPTHLPPH